jgi:hypothetical protein
MMKSASSSSSIGIGGNTLTEIINTARIEDGGTPKDMSPIKVNNFPFKGILTKDGEKA